MWPWEERAEGVWSEKGNDERTKTTEPKEEQENKTETAGSHRHQGLREGKTQS